MLNCNIPNHLQTPIFSPKQYAYCGPFADRLNQKLVHNPWVPLSIFGPLVFFFGVPQVIPLVTHWPGTVIAVNPGGAVIPIILPHRSGQQCRIISVDNNYPKPLYNDWSRRKKTWRALDGEELMIILHAYPFIIKDGITWWGSCI